MNNFFHMGGYGVFIWVAYGLTIGVMAWMLIASIRAVYRNEKELRKLQERRSNRRSHPQEGDKNS